MTFFSKYDLSPSDIDGINLLLSGHSVIDWHSLAFYSKEEVDRFLRVNEFNPDSIDDMNLLEEIRDEAVDYLSRHLDYVIPKEIASDIPVSELFMIASKKDKFQSYACIVLKAMHVIHHLSGREVLFHLPVSDDQIFAAVENKVLQVVDELRSSGQSIVEFAWSRKEKSSLITKLLAKRESIAAHVYDKLRFRLIARNKNDLIEILKELLHRLVPFNYIIPGQTVNKLIEPIPVTDPHRSFINPSVNSDDFSETNNRFSGPKYKVLNFVADLPIRVSQILKHSTLSPEEQKSFDPRAVVFILTEFQVLDEQTEKQNEQHENSHQVYKERQKNLVKNRLTMGNRFRSLP